jgi:hypothetical protein
MAVLQDGSDFGLQLPNPRRLSIKKPRRLSIEFINMFWRGLLRKRRFVS